MMCYCTTTFSFLSALSSLALQNATLSFPILQSLAPTVHILKMTSSTALRITLALALVAFAIQAAPLPQAGGCNADAGADALSYDSDAGFNSNDLNENTDFDNSRGPMLDTVMDSNMDPGTDASSCSQNVDSGSVSLASTVNMVPITNVTPVNRYQPIVQTFEPIVQSICKRSPLNTAAQDERGMTQSQGQDQSNVSREDMSFLGSYMGATTLPVTLDCTANPGAESCQTSIPPSTTDLGSQVTIQPQNQILASTTYQNRVQSLHSNIEAAPAQYNSLPQHNVDLGSSVSIQPTTQVLPQTLYQPEVHQLATDVQAASDEDQSLPQSSVNLGSSVQIRPTVSVTPLTVFQPSIKSLPFIIDVAPCEDNVIYGGSNIRGGIGAGYGQQCGQQHVQQYVQQYGQQYGQQNARGQQYGQGYGQDQVQDQASSGQEQQQGSYGRGAGQRYGQSSGQPSYGQGLGQQQH
ncbi:hypothetical protein EDD11_001926 [Mortierella claussenii]|nr:hypothetical protein EDD11_001926 [Mortierella claussenii]